MNTHKKWYLFLVIIVLFIVVGVGYWWLQKSSPKSMQLNFSISPTSGAVPLMVTTSVLDACKFYKIDWGDGKTESSYNAQKTCEYQKQLLGAVTHVYNSQGMYTVKIHYQTELFGVTTIDVH